MGAGLGDNHATAGVETLSMEPGGRQMEPGSIVIAE